MTQCLIFSCTKQAYSIDKVLSMALFYDNVQGRKYYKSGSKWTQITEGGFKFLFKSYDY